VLKSVLCLSAAFAAVAPFAAQAVVLDDETLIVSATRVPTPVAQVATSNSIVTAADIAARQQRDLPTILRSLPGTNVMQTGGAGGQTSLFLRGSNPSHTKVLLDGIDISDPSSPANAVDFGKLMAGDIARVEVLRGPQSGLYGSDALGGVVNIITQTGEGPLKLNSSAEGGSFDTFNQTVSAGGSDGAFHATGTLQHVHAGATPVTPLNLLPAGQRRNDDYFDNVTASTRLGYDVMDNFDIGFVGRYNGSVSRITGDAFDFNTFTSYPSPTQTRVALTQYQARTTAHLTLDRFEQTLGLAYHSVITNTADPDNGPSRFAGDRIKLDWQGNLKLDDATTVVLGAETARDTIHVPLSRGATLNSGYAEVQTAWGELAGSASVRLDDHSRFGSKVTWRVAPVWNIEATGTRLKASVGTGFKAPSLSQLFQDFPSFGFFANPNLKPETSTGYDVGLEQTLGDVSGGVTFFHNDIKNLISNNASFTSNINVGKAETQGVECFVAWKVLENLSLRADYTYTDAADEVAHLALLRRPRNKINLGADWQATDDVQLSTTLVTVGPQIDGNRDFSIPRQKMASYTLANVAASWRITDNYTLFGGLENAFDQTYQNPGGFQRPGIGAYGGIKASF
jgi:vitamin B12 transporter